MRPNLISRRSKIADRSAFTLVEVLATLMLVGVVLPVVVRATGMSAQLGAWSDRQATAASLADAKLAELNVLSWMSSPLLEIWKTPWGPFGSTSTPLKPPSETVCVVPLKRSMITLLLLASATPLGSRRLSTDNARRPGAAIARSCASARRRS